MKMEARAGLEPANRGFADLSLSLLGTAPFLSCQIYEPGKLSIAIPSPVPLFWSGRWDLNPRPSAWQADVLPLNYARIGPYQAGLAFKLPESGFPVNITAPEDFLSIFMMWRVLSRLTPGALADSPVGRKPSDRGIKRSMRRGAPEPHHPPPHKHRTINELESVRDRGISMTVTKYYLAWT